MKLLKPSSLRMLKETAYYSGDNGTYASVMPSAEASAYIQTVCEKAKALGFDATGPLDQHVTVIHSKKGLTPEQQEECWLNGFTASRTFTATIKGFTHWGGHNDSGYVVLEVDCPELTKLNGWLRQTYDLPVSFDDYKAHITIAQDAYKVSADYADKLTKRLNGIARPKYLTFTGLRIEDLK